MDNPAAHSLMEMVRQINEMGRRARSGEPTAADYLRAVSSDPMTEWFTDLLREKRDELAKESERMDRLISALRAWHSAIGKSNESGGEANGELVRVLHELGVIRSD
jgi:hypothetical protein